MPVAGGMTMMHDATGPRPADDTAGEAGSAGRLVRDFRQILVWPLQLMPLREGSQIHNHFELFAQLQDKAAPLWTKLDDEFPADPRQFQERHYREFATFLPQVQRFLYGERASRTGRISYGDSPMRIFRRRDIAGARVTLRAGAAPVEFAVAHVDLYFFYDVDIVMLAFEMSAEDIPLAVAQETMYRFGRAYPAGWLPDGSGEHCPAKVEWLDRDGRALAASDYDNREKFLASVCRNIAPDIAAHWGFLLQPMRINHHEPPGALRYRQLEYYRMPLMAYLALDEPETLTRADHVRLGLVTTRGEADSLPYSGMFLADFERRYCYDRFHDRGRSDGWSDTRIVCSGHALVAVGNARRNVFTDSERGFLAQFRHQIFLIGLIAHFHRAALLMISDRLISMMTRLDIDRPETIAPFRRDIRQTLEIFLRFTHRYWFCEVSDQAMARDLWHMWTGHLATQRIYSEVREEIFDMNQYLDSDVLRRQSMSMLRLAVVAILSLIGTITTGVLGMNLIDATQEPLLLKIAFFGCVFALVASLTFFTVMKSRRLSEFFDAMSDDRSTWKQRLAALGRVFR